MMVTIFDTLLGLVMTDPANMPADVAVNDIKTIMKYMVKNC